MQEQQDELHDVGPYDVTRDGDGLPVLTRAVRQYGSANSTRFCFRDCRVSGCGAVFRGSCDGLYASGVEFASSRRQTLPVWNAGNSGRLVDLTIRANLPSGYDKAWIESSSNPNFHICRVHAESTSGVGAPLLATDAKPAAEDMWGAAASVSVEDCSVDADGSAADALLVFRRSEPALLVVRGCHELHGRFVKLARFGLPISSDADLNRTVCSGESLTPRLTHRWTIAGNGDEICLNLPKPLLQCLECPIPEALTGAYPALDAPVADPSSGPYEDFDAADYGVTLESSESDASSRLQSLFDAAAKSANPRVLLPGRTILIARSVTIPRKVRIVGEGRSIIRSQTKDHTLIGVADGDAPLAVSFDNVGLVWGDIAVEAAGAGAILFRNGVLIGNRGFKVAARGGALALDAVDTTVYSPRFVESDGADVRLKDSWTEFTPRGGCSSLYLIRGGTLRLEGVLGVPIAGGDPFVWPRIGSLAEDEYVFWIRNEGGVVRSADYRYGGEFGGFPVLDQTGTGKAFFERNILCWGNPSGNRRAFSNASADAEVLFDHLSFLGLGNSSLRLGGGVRPKMLVVRGSRIETCAFEDGEDLLRTDFCENCYHTYIDKRKGETPVSSSTGKLAGCGGAALLSAFAAFAAPVIPSSSVSLTQSGSKAVITYDLLDEAAIVTVDIQTNGVSVGSSLLQNVSGDVNQIVQPGESKKIVWKVGKAAPDAEFAGAKAVVTAWTQKTPPPYLVANLTGTKETRYYASWDAMPGTVTDRIYKTDKIVFRHIPARGVNFRMGAKVRYGDAAPGNSVVLTNDFWIGVYELTQAQYKHLMGSYRGSSTTLGREDCSTYPVECISFAHACGEYNDNTKRNYYLYGGNSIYAKIRQWVDLPVMTPTEAQWEFAARAGRWTDYPGAALADPTEPDETEIGKVAWYAGNSGGATHPVGEKAPNAFGLYDMLGNVCELQFDWYDQKKYTGIKVDPFVYAEIAGYGRTLYRGGDYSTAAADVNFAYRPYLGSYTGVDGSQVEYNWAQPGTGDNVPDAVKMRFGIRLAAIIW